MAFPPRVRAAFASLVVLAGVGAAVVVAGGSGTGARSVSVASASGPTEVVAAIDGRLVVLSAVDGSVERVLAGDPAAFMPVTEVAPTPDGLTIYFTVGQQCGGRTPQLYRVATDGGVPELVAAVAMSPRVSPDGRYLAYASSGVLSPGDCGPFDTLVVRDLTNGSTRALDFGSSVGGVAPLAWVPGARLLAVAGWIGGTQGPGRMFVDVSPAGLAVDGGIGTGGTGSFRLAGNGLAYLPTGDMVSAFPTTTSSRIATIDPATGVEARLVVEVPRPLYLVDVDVSGTSFLLVGPLADTPDGHDLYRAGVADPAPVLLASHVTAAAWLPAPATALPLASSEPSTTVTSTTSVPSTSNSTSTSTTSVPGGSTAPTTGTAPATGSPDSGDSRKTTVSG